MRGDLSTTYRSPERNFNGVLYQQGRVFLDRDGNAQTAITTEWEDLAARDVIGAGVLGVPASQPNSFKVEQAERAGSMITLTVDPGRAWADGMLIRLDGAAPVKRVATPLGPPLQTPPANPPAAGDRDAVVLEVCRHEVHALQLPNELLEPALGGVDTTERLATGLDFRLFRMGASDTCETIGDRLKDDPANKAKLTVSLQPTVVVNGDCPTVEGGGYTGFEHSLYRIEIAATTAGPRMFKWSQFNGGLVGRGTFDAVTKTATITANLTAITSSELTSFYLETVEWDDDRGVWAVTYGATVSLAGDRLTLPAAATFGTLPAAGKTVFFRLWNGIRPISDFPIKASPNPLQDGILLQFDADATGKYAAEDYWTFQVRAGGPNSQVLVDNRPPDGIVYHLVPVAVLEWDGTAKLTAADRKIEDCRQVFPPLTRLKNCCTYRVGDGAVSHGDFDSIQDAIDALPPEGGKVCVLPGTFRENVLLQARRGVTISGCGPRTVVRSRTTVDPVFHVKNASAVTIEHLAVEAGANGVGVLLEAGMTVKGTTGALERVTIDDLLVLGTRRSAIDCRDGVDVTVEHCDVRMLDSATTWPGIFFIAQDGRIQDNVITVLGASAAPPTAGVAFGASAALGGIQLGGGCERVVVRGNRIQGGVGNGITLGSVSTFNADLGWVLVGWVVNADDPCNPCLPGETAIVAIDPGDGQPGPRSDGPLWDVLIEDNQILDMGLNGIGVIGFFDLKSQPEVVSVYGLGIVENEIRRCLRRQLAPIRQEYAGTLGYGGIALSDTAFLEIRENVIEDNGPDHLDPVCGIFVVHGESVEIVENRITNNGAKTVQPPSAARPGPRGGIYIGLCTQPTGPSRASERHAVDLARAPVGGTSLRVHGNRVIAPLGRALTASTLGDVSVLGNHLTSLGIIAAPPAEGDAATVQLNDLGRTSALGGKASFAGIRTGGFANSMFVSKAGTGKDIEATPPVAPTPQVSGDGRILFADNQVSLIVLEPRLVTAWASVSILSLSDVSYHDNQCDVRLADGILMTNVASHAFSLRVSDNRLSEGLPNAVFSAITLGVMNMTTDNQASHCLAIRGWASAGFVVNQPNTVLVNALQPTFCGAYGAVLSPFGTKLD